MLVNGFSVGGMQSVCVAFMRNGISKEHFEV